MKLLIIGHKYQYEMLKLTQIFYPNTKIDLLFSSADTGDDETVIIEDLAAFSAPDWGTLRLTIPVTWGSKADIDSESPIAIFDAAQWNALLGLSGGAPKYWRALRSRQA